MTKRLRARACALSHLFVLKHNVLRLNFHEATVTAVDWRLAEWLQVNG